MKRILAAAVGLSGILAACGSAGVAPDGTVARVVGISTEFKVQGSAPVRYVGCDNNTTTDPARKTSTQVVVTFAVGGTISKVDVALVGTQSSQYNESQTLTADALAKNADGNYQAIFDFKSATGDFLPASIIVTPKPPTVRTPQDVTVNGADKVGAFYADLKVYTSSGDIIPITSKNLTNIEVYRQCTLASTAQPLSQ